MVTTEIHGKKNRSFFFSKSIKMYYYQDRKYAIISFRSLKIPKGVSLSLKTSENWLFSKFKDFIKINI